MFLKYTSKHCKLNRTNNFEAILMTESLCSTMDVCDPEPLGTKHGVIQFFRLLVDMFVLFLISYKFDVCMIGKNYCTVNVYAQTSQIDCFRSVHEILRWTGSNDLSLQNVIIFRGINTNGYLTLMIEVYSWEISKFRFIALRSMSNGTIEHSAFTTHT